MDYLNIDLKKSKLSYFKNVPDYLKNDYEMDFKVKFTHHSTAIEGNTLTLIETKLIIEDGISVGGKNLREIHEVENFARAYDFINECIKNKINLNEKILKDIHEILMNNIIPGGIYRNHDVYITGSEHQPPSPQDAYYQMKDFFNTLKENKILHPIELASYAHAEFVKIHPFPDGNGRTARLILNYILQEHGYRPILITIKDKLEYFNALESYSVNGNKEPFLNLISKKAENELDRYIKIAEQYNKGFSKKNIDLELE